MKSHMDFRWYSHDRWTDNAFCVHLARIESFGGSGVVWARDILPSSELGRSMTISKKRSRSVRIQQKGKFGEFHTLARYVNSAESRAEGEVFMFTVLIKVALKASKGVNGEK